MSIRSNIEEVMKRIKDGDLDFGEEVRRIAVNAIKSGEDPQPGKNT